MSALSGKKITVRAGRKILLDEVDVEVDFGETHILAGPNGAGKSTLLKTVTGEVNADDGQIWIDGKDREDWAALDLAKKRACLPQSSALSFPFTIREVVAIGRFPYKERRAVTEKAVEEALERVGLRDRSGETYLHLSGGERQRVHLARVMAQLDEPKGKILLLDEPTSSLDLTFQQMVFRVAKEWASSGAAVVIVLHDLNHVMRHGDRVSVLAGGRLVAAGSPREVLTPKLISGVYEVGCRWIESGGHRLLAVES